MLDREMAGIARFILTNTANPTPYYNNVAENFLVPSVYFPPAIVESSPFSFGSYEVSYSWFIKFFAKDKLEAFALARLAMEALLYKKRLVPLYDMDGIQTGESLRINNPSIKGLDGGACQLNIGWDVVRLYEESISPKMLAYKVAGKDKQEDVDFYSCDDHK